MSDLPKCKICGDFVPFGKEYCWCCGHAPKLHKTDLKYCGDKEIKVKEERKTDTESG